MAVVSECVLNVAGYSGCRIRMWQVIVAVISECVLNVAGYSGCHIRMCAECGRL